MARLLGLFPAWDELGGVQVSGRTAWGAIASYAESRGSKAILFQHTPPRDVRLEKKEPASRLRSRLETALSALRHRDSFDLVIVWHLGLLPLLPLLQGCRAKTVVFLHGIEAWTRRNPLDRALLRGVDLFLCNSDHTWSRFLEAHPEAEAKAHATVSLGLGRPIEGKNVLPQSPPAALMLGRMIRSEDYKGHREVISAWPRVTARVPGAELWIAGDGDLRCELEELARKRGPCDSIRFLGQVGETEKLDLLQRCHCLALPSDGEGFGLVYVEAMRVGRPCLVGANDAGREVVAPPEAGLAASPKEPEPLVDALAQLLTPGPRWEAWSQAARRRYERRYTEQHFQERLIAALNELLPRAKSAEKCIGSAE